MGELQPLGKAFAIIAVMTHGPNLPTELAERNLRHCLFIAAAKYALSDEGIQTFWNTQITKKSAYTTTNY